MKFKILLLVFIGFAFLSLVTLLWRGNQAKEPELQSEPLSRSFEHVIAQGETFSKLAASLGLNTEQAVEVLAASIEIHDLANLKIGNKIQTFFNAETSEFQRLEYQINQNNLLLIKPQEGRLIAEQAEIEYDIELTKASGTIEGSLYGTAKNLGLADKTIIELADIFAWDIDFGFDVQVGDEFELIYEKRFLKGKEASPGKILIAKYQAQDNIHWAIYYKDAEGNEDYYDLEGNNLRRQFLRAPLQYKYISSGFSYQRAHPVLGRYTQHTAIDYAAPTGTPVSSTGAGTITFVGWQGGVGETVIIRHNGVYNTRYSHLSNYSKGIRVGAKVFQGQIIGFVGSTGHLSTGPHLEYAMTKYGKAVNPLLQNFDQAEPISNLYQEDFNLQKEKLLNLIKHYGE